MSLDPASSPLRCHVHHTPAENYMKPFKVVVVRGNSTAVHGRYPNRGEADAVVARLKHDDRERRKQGAR